MLFTEDDRTRKTKLARCCPEVSVVFASENRLPVSVARHHG